MCSTVFLMCTGSVVQASITVSNPGSIGAKRGQLERPKCSASAAQGLPPSSQVIGWLILRCDVSAGSSPVPSVLVASATV